ncbi:MAG: hypothetical protein Q7Q73_08835 [Verrucomicrobiota bacterium JB024]|nr:hypothetical protein [Verrucomicrobiota bacterium JB024]
MSRPTIFQIATSAAPRGFALLIAITLMAFVVMLLVSMTSLIRIETQVATNSQQLSMSRQNALMALNIALGELQKLAGPDRRTTASADIVTTDLVGLPEKPTLPTSDAGYESEIATWEADLETYWATRSAHWTGVWGPDSAPGDIFTATPEPVFLGWLVSGAARPTFSSETSEADFGKVTVTADGDSSAASASDEVSETESAVWVGDRSAVLLVGPGTVGSSAPVSSHVAAPLIDIEMPASSVSGQTGSSDITVGRYAFWVGDEGVKARFNHIDPYANAGDDLAEDEASYRLLAAQRAAAELLTGFESLAPNTGTLERVVSTGDASFITGLDAAIVGARFHDVTPYSSGVLADAQRGGLRQDLTYYFERGITPEGDALTGGGTALLSCDGADTVRPSLGPTWERAESFYDLGNQSGPVRMRPATATQMGISPVITQYRVFFTLVRGVDDDSFDVRIQMVFVLGNPYTVAIHADSLEFYFQRMSDSDTKRKNLYFKIGTENIFREDFNRLMNRFVFRTGAVEIPPGEAKVFTLTDDVPLTVTADNEVTGSDVIVEMTEGFEPPFNALVASVHKSEDNDATDCEWNYDTLNASGSAETTGAYYNHVVLRDGVTGSILQRQERMGVGTPPQITYDLSDGGDSFPGPTFSRKLKTVMEMSSSKNARIHADYNLRAQLVEHTVLHYAAQRGFNENPVVNGGVMTADPTAFSADGIDEARWGMALDDAHGKTLFAPYDLPRDGTDAAPVWLSLGQLSHADLTCSSEYVSVSSQPGRLLGNAWASPYVQRHQCKTDASWSGSFAVSGNNNSETYYDLSYQLNAALWDSWYFSTIPQTASFEPSYETVLPNGRLCFVTGGTTTLAQARDPSQAAAHLLLEGAFNVNSTSVEAWRAILGALRGLDLRDDTELSGPFPLSLRQPLGSANADDGSADDAWAGFRNLSESELDELSRHIVRQVKLRGPFLSLGHFINRKLIASPYVPEPDGSGDRDASETADTEQGLRGALQAAIDTAGVNDGIASSFSDVTTPAEKFKVGYQDWRAGEGDAAMGIPGWLSQADLLQPLGPVIASRSDTFVIRAYGESLNPVTSQVEGKAWCEAVVQRFPDYMDTTADAWASPASLSSQQAENAVNFGRRFRIVSFRWLSPDDI